MVTLRTWEEQSIFTDRDGSLTADELLFHYTSVERAAAIALTGSLLLSPLRALNDPRESQARATIRVTYGLGSPFQDSTDLEKRHDEVLSELRDSIRVACFTADQRGSPGRAEDADARGFARSRMWAQYADSNQGCCLAFDRRALLESAATRIDLMRSGQVQYRTGFDPSFHEAGSADFNDPVTMEPGSDPAAQHERVLRSLLLKNADWRDEREFRIIADRWIGDSTCAIDVAGAIRGIAFGLRLPPHHLPIVEALRRTFALTELDLALMMLDDTGILAAYPIIGPDDRAHRWTDDDVRSWGVVFDEPT